MRPLLTTALLLFGQAAALQPADVIRTFAASLDTTRQGTPECTQLRRTLAAQWYPAVPTSKAKFIDTYAYVQDLDVETNKVLVDLHMRAAGFEAFDAWSSDARLYSHPSTPNYAYGVNLFKTASANEFVDRTAVCLTLAGIRP
jgi:hypothetical protein